MAEKWTDFRSGDVVVEPSGYTRIARLVEWGQEYGEYGKYERVPHLLVEAEESKTVILAGGGTAQVLPLEKYPGGWPSEGFQVYRCGKLVYGG